MVKATIILTTSPESVPTAEPIPDVVASLKFLLPKSFSNKRAPIRGPIMKPKGG